MEIKVKHISERHSWIFSALLRHVALERYCCNGDTWICQMSYPVPHSNTRLRWHCLFSPFMHGVESSEEDSEDRNRIALIYISYFPASLLPHKNLETKMLRNNFALSCKSLLNFLQVCGCIAKKKVFLLFPVLSTELNKQQVITKIDTIVHNTYLLSYS